MNLHYYLGAFSNRYGTPGEYDEGRYGTPLIARTNGAGEAIVANLQVAKDWTILLEQGLLGQSNKVPADLTPEAWNDFADPNVGAKAVFEKHRPRIINVEVSDPGAFEDVDTPEDYERLNT